MICLTVTDAVQNSSDMVTSAANIALTKKMRSSGKRICANKVADCQPGASDFLMHMA